MLTIHEAAKAKDKEAVLEFLQDEVSINEADHQYGYTPLHEAAQFHGDVDFLVWLEDLGADVSAKNFQGQEMIHVAAAAGRSAAIDHFLSHGQSLASRSNIGWTPLMYSAKFNGDVAFLKFLMSRGADVNARDPDGKAGIHLAAEGGQREAVKWFKQKGQNINMRDHRGLTPLHCGTKSCGSVPFIRFLKRQGAEKNLMTADGQSMIHLAASRGHKEAVVYFKKKGQSINSRDRQGWTPLLVAAKANGSVSFLLFLIEQGADVGAKTVSGAGALHVASQGAHRKAVAFLLARGFDVNAVDRNGFTPLHDAVEMKASVEFLDFLASKGADVTRVTNAKQTILHSAVRGGYVQGVEWGVARGVDIFAKDEGGTVIGGGKSPLDYAVDFRKTDCLEALLKEAERRQTAAADAAAAAPKLGRIDSIKKTLSFRNKSPDLRRKYSQKVAGGRSQSLRHKLSFRTFKTEKSELGNDRRTETIMEMNEV